MPRRPRAELAGAVHHVVSKTPSGRVLFHNDADRRRYLRLVAREVDQRGWNLMTYCLMTNHVHLLVRTPEPDLGAGFKRINERFARSLNDRYELHGHAFGSRFHSSLVRTDGHLLGALRYIARNPVKHGACSHPRAWTWSAHRALAGLTDPPPFLDVDRAYDYLGADGGDPRLIYVELTAKSDGELLRNLATQDSDGWLITAIDDFAIPLQAVAAFLETGVRNTQRRLAAARVAKGSVPFATR